MKARSTPIHGDAQWHVLRSRFEEKIMPEPNSGCWLWMGAIDPHLYGQFFLGTDKHNRISAHRASWIIYKSEDPADAWVLHKCDIPFCVNPDHLFLGNAKLNVEDKYAKGRQARHVGEENGRAKLTNEQVAAILADPRSHRVIANDYGISEGPIGRIKTGKLWRHITRGNSDIRGTARGQQIGNSKLSPDIVRKIRDDPRPQAKIAADHGICQMTVSMVKQRKIWRHVK